MMRATLLTLLVFVTTTMAHAQEMPAPTWEPAPTPETKLEEKPAPVKVPQINFSGTLIERGTRTPLAGVLITLYQEATETSEAEGFETTTDAQGAFQFFDVRPGKWKVFVDPDGYFPVRSEEQINVSEKLTVTYHIEKASYNPFDVLVQAPRPRKEVSRTTLQAQEIEKLPGSFGDPIQSVRNLPSVARVPFGSGDIIVRGSAPQDTGIYIDGVNVPLVFHFGGLRSVIPTGMLENIDFYPGNFSPYYGRATGGILDINTKKLQPTRIKGYVDVSLLDTALYLESPLGDNASIAIGARRSYVDFIINAAVPDDASVNFLVAPRYYDEQLLLKWRPTSTQQLRLFAFGSDDSLKLLFSQPSDFNTQIGDTEIGQSTRFYRVLMTHEWTPTSDFKNDLRFSFGRNWLEVKGNQTLRFDLNFYQNQLRDTATWKISDWLQVRAGLDNLFMDADINILLPRPPKEGDATFSQDFSQLIASRSTDQRYWFTALFAEAEIKPIDKLLLLPGVRVEYTQQVSAVAAEPRLAARYAVNDMFTVKSGVGLFRNAPSFDETDKYFGNPNLGLKSAMHYSAGLEAKPRKFLFVDSTLFYKQLYNQVSRTSDTLERDGEIVPKNYNNEGKGRVYGVDLLVRHEFSHNFFGWIAYTLSRSERMDSGTHSYRLFDYDQTHILTMLGTYSLPNNWDIGFRWRLVSGNPTTPLIGGVYNSDYDRYDPITGTNNSARLTAFHQLDIRVDKRWVYDSWMLNFYIDIQNIYNRPNAEDRSYNFDYSQSTPQTGLPLLTVLGLRAEF